MATGRPPGQPPPPLRAPIHSPDAPSATGACSRDEPQPKFSPPMMTGYCVFMLPSDTNLQQARAGVVCARWAFPCCCRNGHGYRSCCCGLRCCLGLHKPVGDALPPPAAIPPQAAAVRILGCRVCVARRPPLPRRWRTAWGTGHPAGRSAHRSPASHTRPAAGRGAASTGTTCCTRRATRAHARRVHAPPPQRRWGAAVRQCAATARAPPHLGGNERQVLGGDDLVSVDVLRWDAALRERLEAPGAQCGCWATLQALPAPRGTTHVLGDEALATDYAWLALLAHDLGLHPDATGPGGSRRAHTRLLRQLHGVTRCWTPNLWFTLR